MTMDEYDRLLAFRRYLQNRRIIAEKSARRGYYEKTRVRNAEMAKVIARIEARFARAM